MAYSDLSPPQAPPAETFSTRIHRAVINPTNVQVIPAATGSPAEGLPPVHLMRENGAEHAYALVDPTMNKFITLNHHAPDWGKVYFAVVYQRVRENVFQAPSREDAKMVAIKQLNKKAVKKYLAEGGEENPYREIDRYQELGDDVHVVRCEALEDDEHIYIVTPKACELGTLMDVIQWGTSDTLDPARAHQIFCKILQILGYLEEHGICHRDFSPDNFLFLSPDNLVAFDLALSHRLPVDDNGRRALCQPQGSFGTPAYMSPEIFRDQIFCGSFGDLWSAAVILYNLLTNQLLCRIPYPSDVIFRYNILARGLSSVPLNERTAEVLQEASEEPGAMRKLIDRALAHLNFTPEAIEILENLLHVSPRDRWTLAQAMESAYVRRENG